MKILERHSTEAMMSYDLRKSSLGTWDEGVNERYHMQVRKN